MPLAYLGLFWAMQVFASVAFKFGSAANENRKRWLLGFVSGNTVGAASIVFLMKIYAAMPHESNLALVLANCGSFIGSQILLALIFRSRLNFPQWAGIALVAVGTAVATIG
ncbi:MAG: hypothetical protein P4L33_14060 [Capsulimonadaceae bacterium]|nr:hypothetical protein [Capsulimonadaceae bacterium]